MRALLDAGADPSLTLSGNEKYTALHYALEDNQGEVVEMLLEAGADPMPTIREQGVHGFMKLHAATRRVMGMKCCTALEAVLSDDAEEVERLLAGPGRHALLLLPDEFKFTMLDHACLHGCTRVATVLEADEESCWRSETAEYAVWGGVEVDWADRGDLCKRLEKVSLLHHTHRQPFTTDCPVMDCHNLTGW